jgi:hypothetical protein
MPIEGYEDLSAEQKEMKESIVAGAQKAFEQYKENKEAILEAVKASEAVPDEAGEEEIVRLYNEMVRMPGYEAAQRVEALIAEGYTYEDMGTTEDEFESEIAAFDDAFGE